MTTCIIASMSGTHAIPSSSPTPWKQVLGVCVLAVAMAYVEAALVRYLRDAVGMPAWRQVLDGRQDLPAMYVGIEQAREAATMVMLALAGYLAGTTWLRRLGCFLLAFGVWDISYYVCLHVLTGFPRSLTSVDILFVIPSQWRGPVWVPTLIATGFVVAGTLLARRAPEARRTSSGAGGERADDSPHGSKPGAGATGGR
jgi:hypothetical protein